MSALDVAALLARIDAVSIAPEWQCGEQVIDWGYSRPKCRRHSLQRSAMHGGPEGRIAYAVRVPREPEDVRFDVNALERDELARYLRARSIGLSHDAAMLIIYHAQGDIDVAELAALLEECDGSKKDVDSFENGRHTHLMNAANDTTPATETFALNATVESLTWRARRTADSITITHLVNAGRTGKVCDVLTISPAGYSADNGALAPFADFVAVAVLGNASLDAMVVSLADVTLCGLEFSRTEKRGVDVSRGPKLTVRGELVDGTFSEVEALISFSFWLDKPGGFKQTKVLGTTKRADAAKAYAWVKANSVRLATMAEAQFRSEMSAIGAGFP